MTWGEAGETQADPYENISVLVEAFLVRVSTEALAEVGVNPIGQSPEGISVLKILSCLDDVEEGEVISGSKLMTRHGSRSGMSNRDTFYIKREKINIRQTPEGPLETKDVRFESYESGVRFEVNPRVQEDGIWLNYEYSDSGVDENEDEMSPPDMFGYDWEGNLSVRSGQPIIAGAAQNEDSVTFLILTATIQD
jgi:hypothetical protein